jgi:hypothetical protein
MTVWMRSEFLFAWSLIPGQRNKTPLLLGGFFPGVYIVSIRRISFFVGPKETCGPYWRPMDPPEVLPVHAWP